MDVIECHITMYDVEKSLIPYLYVSNIRTNLGHILFPAAGDKTGATAFHKAVMLDINQKQHNPTM